NSRRAAAVDAAAVDDFRIGDPDVAAYGAAAEIPRRVLVMAPEKVGVCSIKMPRPDCARIVPPLTIPPEKTASLKASMAVFCALMMPPEAVRMPPAKLATKSTPTADVTPPADI